MTAGPRLHRPRAPLADYIDYFGYWARETGNPHRSDAQHCCGFQNHCISIDLVMPHTDSPGHAVPAPKLRVWIEAPRSNP